MRPVMERMWIAVARAVREHKLNPRWTGIGHLLDAMAGDKEHDDVATWICVTMHERDLTRSCFIAAFFEYLELPSIARIAIDEYAKIPKNRKAKRKKR